MAFPPGHGGNAMASSIFAAQVLLARGSRPVNLVRLGPGHGVLPDAHWGTPFQRRSQVLGILRCAWIRETSSVGLWRHVDRQCCHVRFSFVGRHFHAASRSFPQTPAALRAAHPMSARMPGDDFDVRADVWGLAPREAFQAATTPHSLLNMTIQLAHDSAKYRMPRPRINIIAAQPPQLLP